MSLDVMQILYLIATYLIASIPFGLLISLYVDKQDIRKYGSGNIGATNISRKYGIKIGIIVLFLDGIKGAMMVLGADYLFVGENIQIFRFLIAAVAVCGHVFPIYLKFKGGKGVATGFAVLMVLNPVLGVSAITIWSITFLLFKISAVSALVSIFSVFGISIFMNYPKYEIIFYGFLAFLMLFRHKSNLKQLIEAKKIEKPEKNEENSQ